MGMTYKKIHTCSNYYISYRKEFEWLKKCPKCGLSCYKVKDKNQNSSSDEMTNDVPL